MGVLRAKVDGVWVDIPGGSEEVFIGPSDPIPAAPTTELWYDTDAPDVVSASTAALGIIAVGSFTYPDGTTYAAGANQWTNAIVFTGQLGRRYRFACLARAVKTLGANTHGWVTLFRDSVAGADRHFQLVSGIEYDTLYHEWIIDGDGASHSWALQIQPTAGSPGILAYTSNGHWYVEDMGPSATPALQAPAVDPPWNSLTLLNGWIPYAGWRAPQYRKVGDMVHIRGLCDGGFATSPIIALMPVGFRPTSSDIFVVHGSDATISGAYRFDVQADGGLRVYTPSPPQCDYVSLDNMMWSTT